MLRPRTRLLLVPLLAVALGLGGTPGSALVTPSLAATPARLAAAQSRGAAVATARCPGSSFECVTLAVPRDHFAATGPTWDVTFAIQRATKVSKGVFVTITGGPGSSGIAAADSYTAAFDPSITANYDIVFLDQRGVGLSHPIQCPDASATYYASPADPNVPAERTAAALAAQAYATDCVAEAKADPADLPFYSTRQAVEDLEAIRVYLGVDKLDLYGESYGTQYVQTYAAAHPDHVAALFLDGPVDLTVDGPTYNAEAARAFDDALTATLADCTAHRSCSLDVGRGTAAAAYDRIAGELARGPLQFRFPTAHGTFITRSLTATDLQTAAVNYLYSQFSRMLLERALAAAARGDMVALARLAYDGLGVDPETLAATADPSWSDAMYYAVECQDYAYYPGAGDPAARFAAWTAAGDAAGIGALQLGSTYYGDLPCLWWPAQPASAARPAPLTATPYPIFVLTATLDPATPIANAMRIYGRASDAYFIVQTGGPHVIFGRGNACPDNLVTDFLAAGTLPATRVTVCNGRVTEPYVRLALPTAAGYRTALQFMSSMADQVVNTDDYNYRLADSTLTMGCDFGGTLQYRPGRSATALVLRGCAFTGGLAMTGTGRIADDGSMTLDVTIPGGRLLYAEDANGHRTVRGTFRDRPVRLAG
ncbi:MAG: alpha/beta fold hydrolase [Candidatus Limnocylindrales bacterium]|nr:alpha/beta fold hydrolase [Candidatus Limnocylindrales bacterium]